MLDILNLALNIKILFLRHFKSKLKIHTTLKIAVPQVQRTWRHTGSSRVNFMEVTQKLYFCGIILSLCTRSCMPSCPNSSPGTMLSSGLQITLSFQLIS
jgi:hypothetical protein